MLLGVFDLLRVKQEELDANRAYIQATRDYWVQYAELERTIGGRLTVVPPTTTQVSPAPATQPMTGHEHHH